MDNRKKRCRLSVCCAVLVRRYTVMVVLVPVLVLLYWLHAAERSWSLRVLSADRARQTPDRTRDNLNNEDMGEYLVDTPTCQIPNSDAFDATVREFIRPPPELDCRNGTPPLTYSDGESVHLITERLHLRGHNPPQHRMSCCTRDVRWVDDSQGTPEHLVPSGRDNISLSAECRPLKDRYTPQTGDGGVEVICTLNGTNGTIVYRNYHQLVPLQPPVEATSHQRGTRDGSGTAQPSVLIFLFDSLSRLQFHRWFPKSRRLLYDQMDAFELGGLNKNGDNTWPNMVRLLAGMDVPELEAHCAPDPHKDHLDECPFMWREFKRAGYRTAMFEDAPNMGMFTYLKAGFRRQPTDYYNRPTSLLAYDTIATKRMMNAFLCEGNRPSYEATFEFTEHLATRLADRPYWAFVAQSTFSHDKFNMPYHLDDPFYSLLKQLLASGALENTVLVTLGDHGLRWGAERQTYIGGLEERLPLVSLYFPPWMRRRYPAAFENLRINQRRLTTFYDLHRTLLDLLTMDTSLGGADDRPAPANASAVSLFRRISTHRRCVDVNVPHHYCTCLRSQPMSVDELAARTAAHTLVTVVNTELRAAPQCAQLRLERVVSAWGSWSSSDDTWSARQRLVTVQVETRPGGARFEATVLGKVNDLLLSGSVSRLDGYGQLQQCVKDHYLEKLCHCIQEDLDQKKKKKEEEGEEEGDGGDLKQPPPAPAAAAAAADGSTKPPPAETGAT